MSLWLLLFSHSSIPGAVVLSVEQCMRHSGLAQELFSEIVVNRSMWVHHRTENIAAALNAMNKQANIQ